MGEHKLLGRAVITLTQTEYHNLKSSIRSGDCFLDFIKNMNDHQFRKVIMSNRRLQQLMKERNIPVLNLRKKPDPIILSGIDDPWLPKQIADELSSRHDIVEIAFFPPSRSWKGQYPVTFKKCEKFRVCQFYV